MRRAIPCALFFVLACHAARPDAPPAVVQVSGALPHGELVFGPTADPDQSSAKQLAATKPVYAIARFTVPVRGFASNSSLFWHVLAPDLGGKRATLCTLPLRLEEGEIVHVAERQRFAVLSLLPKPDDFDGRQQRARDELKCTQALAALPNAHVKLRVILASVGDGVRPQDVLADGALVLDLAGKAVERELPLLQCRLNGPVAVPRAMRDDTVLEAEVARILGEGAKVLRVAITDADWIEVHDPNSTVVLRRTIGVAVARREKDGTCRLRRTTLVQPVVSDRFGATLPPQGVVDEAICCDRVG